MKSITMKNTSFLLILLFVASIKAQTDTRMYEIIENINSERIKKDITTLASFGTRHSLSDTISKTRGIGAARRWIHSEFEKISSDCDDCLDIFYQKNWVKKNNRRIIRDVMIVNVVAIQKGTKYPNRYGDEFVMT